MNDSDRKYLSRFALDPDTDYDKDDIAGFDLFPCVTHDDDLDPFDSRNLDTDDLISEDNFIFGKYAGTGIKIDDVEHVFTREGDISSVYE